MAAQPKLSDLYTQRQIAKIWFRSLIGGAITTAIAGSPLFTTRAAWVDPIAWVQLVVVAAGNIWLVLRALSTDDYREMAPIDPAKIP